MATANTNDDRLGSVEREFAHLRVARKHQQAGLRYLADAVREPRHGARVLVRVTPRDHGARLKEES
jgi:hypothetical protein